MHESIIYITGSPEFKSVLRANLDREWLQRMEDVDEDTLSILLTEKVTLEDMKLLIGEEIISGQHLLFFDEPPEDPAPPSRHKYIPGLPVKMTVWVNSTSKLSTRKSR